MLNSVLSDFCKRLTGIRQVMQDLVSICPEHITHYILTQTQVDSAPTFSEVFRNFSLWMEEKELGTKFKFAVLTDW